MTAQRMPEPDYSLLPKMVPIRQEFPRPTVDDITRAAAEELRYAVPAERVRQGARIGITAGSRGISNIAQIVKAAVDYFRELGADPFVIPAMGSHGGATAEGQAHLVEHYGVTEKAVGAPIRAEMETVSLGASSDSVEAFLAKAAFESDGILLLNRIKPHTDYKGEIESGLSKICGIGLGKREGAEEYHGHLFGLGLGEAIRSAAERVAASGKIIGGLGILENAYHDTAKLAGVRTEELLDREPALLKEAKLLMPRLPLDDIHVLLCDRMGKNISGCGLDTNIIGRSVRGYQDVSSWCEGMPVIRRIVVEDLTEESDGNATAMGLVDFITRRFYEKIDYYATAMNCFVSCGPQSGKTPFVLSCTKDALAWAIQTCGRERRAPKVVYIRDTLHLSDLLVSEHCLPELRDNASITIVSDAQQMPFAADGYIRSPFSD